MYDKKWIRVLTGKDDIMVTVMTTDNKTAKMCIRAHSWIWIAEEDPRGQNDSNSH